MKFPITFAVAAAFLPTLTSDAFSAPRVIPLSPGVGNSVVDNTADDAMSQYEAALKAAFEQASANAVPSTENQQQEILQQQPSTTPAATTTTTQQPSFGTTPASEKTQAMVDANTDLLGHVQQQEQAIDQYEAALEAALQSSSVPDTTNSAPSTIVFGDEAQQASQAAAAAAAQERQPDWANISKDISSKIEIAESKIGGPLDAASKGEIVGTVLAGSAVLGTAAINSPLLMGAALGYAGTHVFGGERGEALAEASKETLVNALTFTKEQIKEEKGDISRAGARIVEHLQNEALGKAREVKHSAETQAYQVSRELSSAPGHLMEDAKKIIESDDFQQMPKRTFKAFTTFLGSDEVKRARERVAQSIKEGFESDEVQAVKDRATRSLKDI